MQQVGGESQECALVEFGRRTCSSAGFASLAACWQQRSQGAGQQANMPAHPKTLVQGQDVAL